MRRSLPLVAVLVLPMLAGCLAGDAPTETVEPAADLETIAPNLTEPTALPQDVFAAEPNVAVLDDGTTFATAPVGLTYKPNAVEGAAWLWRSRGNGSWEVLRSPHVVEGDGQVPYGAFCSCDADVVTSPDGWTYYSDWWIAGLAAGNYLVEASPDGGETWNKAPVTIPEPSSVDRQWLLAGDDGLVGVFYSYFGVAPVQPGPVEDTPVGGQALQAVFSTDHGQTWSTPTRVVPAEDGWSYQIGHPRWVGNGTIVMPYGAVRTGNGSFWTAPSEVRVAISDDDGRTWEQVRVAEVPGGFDNLWAVQGAVDDTGTIHVAWAARTGDNMTVLHSQSPDGRSWSEPTAIRSEGLNFLPWVAATGDGRVAVGWYGGNATDSPMEAGGNATWYAYLAERSGPAASWSVRRVDGRPVKVGPLCPHGAACSGDRELLDYVSLTYGPENRLRYAFARSETVDGIDLTARVHVAAEVG